MNTNFIFVYGLLKSIYDNEPARFVRKHCQLVDKGYFSGKLFDIGTYPGAIYDPESGLAVHGEVYWVTGNQLELETFLDHFEGVGLEFEKPNEYKREIIPVTTGNKILNASCYLYNWNLDRAKLIASGRYQNEKGNRGK